MQSICTNRCKQALAQVEKWKEICQLQFKVSEQSLDSVTNSQEVAKLRLDLIQFQILKLQYIQMR